MGKMLVTCDSHSRADSISRAPGGRFVTEQGYLEGDALVLGWCDGQVAELAPPEAYDPGFARSGFRSSVRGCAR